MNFKQIFSVIVLLEWMSLITCRSTSRTLDEEMYKYCGKDATLECAPNDKLTLGIDTSYFHHTYGRDTEKCEVRVRTNDGILHWHFDNFQKASPCYPVMRITPNRYQISVGKCGVSKDDLIQNGQDFTAGTGEVSVTLSNFWYNDLAGQIKFYVVKDERPDHGRRGTNDDDDLTPDELYVKTVIIWSCAIGGSILFIFFTAVVIACCCCRRRRYKGAVVGPVVGPSMTSPLRTTTTTTIVQPSAPAPPPYNHGPPTYINPPSYGAVTYT